MCLDGFKTSGLYNLFHAYGTAGIAENACLAADTPIRNWGGVPADMPSPDKISDDSVNAYLVKPYGCWRCPIACGGHMKVKEGKYAGEGHRPEYETLGVFGTMCLNNNIESIIKVNDICNRAGMDTIGAGATVAFALECYERGLITKEDAGGLELTWGNDEAIVKLTEMIAKDEGIGKVLSNGVQAAARKLGVKKCEEFAMHVAGEELPMHDPRLNPGLATSYQVDATPGRHTQMGAWFHESSFAPPGSDKYYKAAADKYVYTGKSDEAKFLSCFGHVMNSAGMCMFGACCCPVEAVPEFIAAVTGMDFTMDDVVKTGQRIGTMRMAFTVREGNVPPKFKLPGRMIGKPPLQAGPLKGVTVDNVTQTREYLQAMGWDPKTAAPLPETLKELGLDSVVKA
jgi:aldehyde:ferredoxin oxidoreductase